MNLLQGLFSRWMGGTFQPLTFSKMIGTKMPVIIDTGNLMKVYHEVPHLRIAIDKKAEMFSNMEVKVVDKNGIELQNHPILDLFQRPNVLQKIGRAHV